MESGATFTLFLLGGNWLGLKQWDVSIKITMSPAYSTIADGSVALVLLYMLSSFVWKFLSSAQYKFVLSHGVVKKSYTKRIVEHW